MEEALDLSFDRLLMMMMMTRQCTKQQLNCWLVDVELKTGFIRKRRRYIAQTLLTVFPLFTFCKFPAHCNLFNHFDINFIIPLFGIITKI